MTDKKHNALCSKLIDALLAIDTDKPAAVVEAFKSVKAKPYELGDAFWTLDSKYGQFREYHKWHPKLRSCRNTPNEGKQLFALFH